VITAAVLYFFVVKPYERLEERLKKNKDEEVSPTDIDLLTEIRDALVARKDDTT
jgi:large conductance mechanosensitive channel